MHLELLLNDDHSYNHALKLIFRLRNVAITSQLCVIALAVWVLKFDNSVLPFLLVSAMLALINYFIHWRIKQDWHVSSSEIAINLLIDIIALAVLLYFAGGSTNPLVSLFIIPVALSAVFLPIPFIAIIVSLTVLLYTFLMQWYIPLPSIGSRFGGDFNLHIMGMYGNFIFSAIIISIFVLTLARNSRKQEQQLALSRERHIRDKHVVATGLLAAHAAHKINTPLSTIGLLADELLSSNSNASNESSHQNIEDIKEIQTQINYCKTQLQALQQKATLTDETELTDSTLEIEIANTISNWITSNPEIQLNVDATLDTKTPFSEPSSITQTIINLLDNAAEASLLANESQVDLSAKYTNAGLIIDIDDYGQGLSPHQLSQIGTKPYSSKPNGMGIGLLLSHSSLEHLGGHVLLNNHKADTNRSGVRARITLPIKGLKQ